MDETTISTLLPETPPTISQRLGQPSLDMTDDVCTDAYLLDCGALLVSSQTFYSNLSNGVETENDGLSFSNCLPRHMDPALMDQDLDQSIENSASAASGYSFFSPATPHAFSPENPGESCSNDPVEALLQTIAFTPVPSEQPPRYVGLLVTRNTCTAI